ncbi:protein transport protein Sec61 subunit gamma-like [Malus sylvestris]|uniref:protein transport protein Sec61 subunit gamma-like n=1 Tax=Malus sylvestris TaxID=3752 RepID=UPI0021AD2C4D|nr:protein transport protein Sec61 subunit gamma-like [Malus sylvestris]
MITGSFSTDKPPPSRRPPHPHLCVLLAVSCILVALICILLLICSSRRPLPRLHVTDLLREFSKDSIRLVKRCHKPDRKEFSKVALRTAIGFVVMGFVGFFVKLIFIPINNIIVGSV